MNDPAAPSAADHAQPSSSGKELVIDPPAEGLLDNAPERESLEESEFETPAVVVVVIAQDPGDHFAEALASIAGQDYPNFSTLVIDAASESPVADRVAKIDPDALIHRLGGSPSFTSAANQALTLVQSAPFLLICHDDVALDPNCISLMVEELWRSNAGIVSPKMVQWDDPRRLLAIGKGSDRLGAMVDSVEANEFDQDQYDSVRDVFVAPSGAQLIRADLFGELGGFDVKIDDLNSDLDLCWRAHLVGARVIAAPNARVRHLQSHPRLGSEKQQRRDAAKSRLRTLLVSSSSGSLLRLLPVAILLLLLEALYSLLAGRTKQAGAALGAITSNLADLPEIRQRRREVEESRKVSDRKVHAFQVSGSARINKFFRGQFGAGQDRFAGVVDSVRGTLGGDDSSANRSGALIGASVVLIMLFGSRHLITRGAETVGQFPDLPGSTALLAEWFGGWRSANTGAPGNPPTALLVLGLASFLFAWFDGLFRLLLTVGPLFLGGFGAWRLVRPFGSLRASALAAVAYSANPLPISAMAAGRWDALVIWAVAPTLIASVLRIQGFAPYGIQGFAPTNGASEVGEAVLGLGPGVVDRSLATKLVRFGLLVSAVVTFVPAAAPLSVLIVGLVGLSGVVVARPAALGRLGLAGIVALAAPVALHAPWAFDFFSQFSWSRLVGPASPEASFDSLADLLRFAPGAFAPSWLSVGLLVAAGLALLIARRSRFDAATSGWMVALGCWLLAWAGRRDLLAFELPAAEILLAPAAAGVALSVGLAMRAVEVDLSPNKFGWQRLAAAVGLIGILAASLGGVRGALHGGWQLPTQSYGDFTEILAANSAIGNNDNNGTGPVRILWLMNPSVAPLDTITTAGGTSFFVTEGGRPYVTGRWRTGPHGFDAEISERIDLAAAEETIRAGQLLAPYGIDMIVVIPQLAPSPYVGPKLSPNADPNRGFVRVLASQLDLVRLTGAPDMIVYRNEASSGLAVSQEGVASFGGDPIDQLSLDPAAMNRVPLRREGPAAWAGTPIPGADVRVAVPGSGWEANSDAVKTSLSDNGMLIVSAPRATQTEEIYELAYQTPTKRRLALAAQLILVGLGWVLAQARTENS